MEPWEDELLWDDDFSDEEEDTDEQIEEADLEMDEDSFADWEDSSDTAPVDGDSTFRQIGRASCRERV